MLQYRLRQERTQPPWHILLCYEFEMRSQTLNNSPERGHSHRDGFVNATRDSELKECFFAAPKIGRWDHAPSGSYNTGSTKGSGGKGKAGKGKKGKGPKAYQTTFLPGTKLELHGDTHLLRNIFANFDVECIDRKWLDDQKWETVQR